MGKANEKIGQNSNDTISKSTMFNYGLGNLGISMIWATIASFLTIYLTDTVGLAAGVVGTIMMVSRVFDGFSDIFMGSIVDRTRTRWGKARPLLFWLAIPLAITFVLLFSVPTSLSGMGKVIYVIVTYNLVTTVFYTACSIPYGTLLSLLSRDQLSKSTTNVVRTAFGAIASLLVSLVTFKIVNSFENPARGWTTMAIIYGMILIATTGITFWKTEEKVGEGVEKKKREKLSFKESVHILAKNKYLMIMVVFSIILSINNFPGLNAYYAKYILGNQNAIGVMTMATMIPSFAVMFLMPALIKRFGKRNCSIVGFVIYLGGCGVAIINPANVTFIMVTCALRGIGIAPAFLSQFAFIADTVEYGEWKTGKRTEGLVNSVCPFGNKLGTGIGTVILSWSMAFAGYDGMLTVQNPKALSAIENVFLYVPILLAIACIILLMFYKLDKEYAQVVADLESRTLD